MFFCNEIQRGYAYIIYKDRDQIYACAKLLLGTLPGVASENERESKVGQIGKVTGISKEMVLFVELAHFRAPNFVKFKFEKRGEVQIS